MRSEPDLHHLSAASSSSPSSSSYPNPRGTVQQFAHPASSYSNHSQSQLGSPPHALPPPSFSLTDYFNRPERSKSLSNIHQFSVQPAGKRRSSHAVPLQTKKTRFEMPPVLHEEAEEDDFPPNRQLLRCASQPVLFSRPGSQVLTHQEAEEDLDLIHSIISREQSLDNVNVGPDPQSRMRAQSLSRIPPDLGRSMPSLHQVSSMHILHENYASNPNLTTLESPPGYHQPGHNSLATPRLSGDMGVVSGYEQHVDMVADSSTHLPIHPELSHQNNLFPLELQTNGKPTSNYGLKQDLQFSHPHSDGLLSPIDIGGHSCAGGGVHEADYPMKPLHVAGSPQMLSAPASNDYHHEQSSDSEVCVCVHV